MDAIGASYCGCNSCEVRNPVFDCILANVGVVNLRLLSDWGVDDKLDVSVLEFIEDANCRALPVCDSLLSPLYYQL